MKPDETGYLYKTLENLTCLKNNDKKVNPVKLNQELKFNYNHRCSESPKSSKSRCPVIRFQIGI